MRDCFFILFSLLILGCGKGRDRSSVLYFSADTNDAGVAEVKGLSEKMDWDFNVTLDPSIFSDDSLSNVSAIVLNVSDINKLDHRAIPQLKRYLEAGGGGLVAIRDTVLDEKGWPWLSAWLENVDGARIDQDKGRLTIVKRDFSEDALSDALKFAIGKNKVPDFSKAGTLGVPDSSRYIREVLVESMDEPLQMAILPNEDVLFIERKGGG